MDTKQIAEYIRQALIEEKLIQVEVSARHIHLSQIDIEALFGKGYKLSPKRELSQPGQYLCEERLHVVGPKGKIENVALLGPPRSKTQLEISKTDAFTLGICPPIRESGDIEGTPGIQIIGPYGSILKDEGVMMAARHIHMTSEEARLLACHDQEKVSIEVLTQRPIIFKEVVVRVHDDYRLRMHIDMDEANAADIRGFTLGKIIK